jgi:hypothetical protein
LRHLSKADQSDGLCRDKKRVSRWVHPFRVIFPWTNVNDSQPAVFGTGTRKSRGFRLVGGYPWLTLFSSRTLCLRTYRQFRNCKRFLCGPGHWEQKLSGLPFRPVRRRKRSRHSLSRKHTGAARCPRRIQNDFQTGTDGACHYFGSFERRSLETAGSPTALRVFRP